MLRAGFKAEDLAFIIEGVDLPAAVAEKLAGANHAADDLEERGRLVALGIDFLIGGVVRCAAGNALIRERVERPWCLKVGLGKSGVDRCETVIAMSEGHRHRGLLSEEDP